MFLNKFRTRYVVYRKISVLENGQSNIISNLTKIIYVKHSRVAWFNTKILHFEIYVKVT